MTASVQTPADVVNIALGRIGYKLSVGSLFEGSDAANLALDIYSQTRDELLRKDDYGFSERNITLTLLKSAPAGGYFPPNVWTAAVNPPLSWLFEYAYPGDCLKVRAVKPTPVFLPVFAATPNVFDIANDASLTPPARVILTNVPYAQCVYTGRVTDPATWDVDYVEALAAALARRLAPSLASLDVVKLEAADEQNAGAVATMRQG